ncbi:nucleoside phosphorylase [bacterium]|nr:nucleoside phosphorylase [bacterium]
MGAPVAGLSLEVSIELGIQNILILGTCGLLNHKIQSGDVIVPERFIREEGTSLHYVPQDISIETNSRLNKMICHTFQSHQISCYQGLHWTTDAPFRETTDKIARYSGQGCHSLDMESSALFAISQYYQKKTAAILIGSDHLSDTGWIPPQPSFQGISDRIQEIIPLLPEILQAF